MNNALHFMIKIKEVKIGKCLEFSIKIVSVLALQEDECVVQPTELKSELTGG